MKIAFINCTGETFTPTKSGALGTHVWELCRAARERDGVEPTVISRTSDVPSYDWPRAVLVDYPRLPHGRIAGRLVQMHRRLCGWGHPREGAYVRNVVAAIEASRAGDGHLILQNDIELAVALRRRFPNARILHNAQNQNPAAWRFRRRFRRSVDRATAVSNFTARWNSAYYGLPIETWYNGVDLQRFSPATDVRTGLLISFVGRTDAAKAPDLLLKAALRLAEKGRKFSLQLLGTNYYGRSVEDDYQRRVREMSKAIEQAGIAVRLPGWVNRADLPMELRRADIHVVPSRWDEPCALATLEGMASGLATVASRTGGTPEVVGDAGMLFDRDDVDALTEHLDRLIQDPGLRNHYRVAARQRAEQFAWPAVWARLKELLKG